MLDIRNYLDPQYEKRLKLASRLIRHLNTYKSLPLHIQPNQNTSMPAKDNKKNNRGTTKGKV